MDIEIKLASGNETAQIHDANRETESYPFVHIPGTVERLASKVEIRKWLSKIMRLQSAGKALYYFVWDKNFDKLLALVEVGLEAPEYEWASLSVIVRKSALNQGVATQSLKLVINRVFHDGLATVITARANFEDAIANRVAEKVSLKWVQAEAVVNSDGSYISVNNYEIHVDDPDRRKWFSDSRLAPTIMEMLQHRSNVIPFPLRAL